ncbi:phage protein Gp27 family protein [Candidatus Cyanaurora vandensis]|uniref:phage protein Gp27 family protein n=1 Tax=Candidatus Cyanaurora vandensis TaxID=2714958 RepID=UPI00257A054E|nr:phage protein Gp27 family protein [Candidatus Cyanaurora vandensis]
MPQRSKISRLPENLRLEFERKLRENNFTDYLGILSWFKEEGYDLSLSQIGRHAKRHRDHIEEVRKAVDLARALNVEVEDEENLLGDATAQWILTLTFKLLTDKTLLEGSPDQLVKLLSQLGNMVAKLSQTQINQKKWLTDVRRRIHEAADRAEAALKKDGGYSPETAALIRAQFLNILPDV